MRLASTAFQASLLYFALLCLLPILSVLLLVLLMLSLNIWKNKNFIRPETAQKKSELQMRIEHTSLERALARMFQPLSSRRFNGEYRNLIITTLVIDVFFFFSYLLFLNQFFLILGPTASAFQPLIRDELMLGGNVFGKRSFLSETRSAEKKKRQGLLKKCFSRCYSSAVITFSGVPEHWIIYYQVNL